jgi:hypothetical protein
MAIMLDNCAFHAKWKQLKLISDSNNSGNKKYIPVNNGAWSSQNRSRGKENNILAKIMLQ